MLGVKLLFLDQAELAAEDEKRTKEIRQYYRNSPSEKALKTEVESNFFRLKTRQIASTARAAV